MGNIPEGKGMMIWMLDRCGTPEQAAQTAADAGLAHIMIKFQQGNEMRDCSYSTRPSKVFLAQNPQAYIDAFENAGIEVHGWAAIFGSTINYCRQERDTAISILQRFPKIRSWTLDIEGDGWDGGGYGPFARKYCAEVKAACPGIPFGLCSYRWPSYHRGVPWSDFLEFMDFHAPQVYWEGAHNPMIQLKRSYDELMALKALPFVPIGSAYPNGSWAPTVDDLNEFVNEAIQLRCPGWGWWEWNYAFKKYPAWGEAIKAHPRYLPGTVELPGYDDLPVVDIDEWANRINKKLYDRNMTDCRPPELEAAQ